MADFSWVLSEERDGICDGPIEIDGFSIGDWSHETCEAFDDIADGEFFGDDFHFSGLDFGEVEDVVDHGEEHFA